MAVVMVSVFDSMGFLAFGLMSPVVLIGNYLYDRRNGRISHRRRLADHEETTAAVAADAAVAVREIEARRRASSPDPAALLDIAMRRRARLWERRRAHDDHLAVRIGTADVPSGVTVEDPAELEHRRVVARAALDVPVCVTLTEHGVVGLAGRTADTRSLATWLVAQLCVLQSPRDVEIVVLTDPDGVDSWSWLRWVPHARGGESADRTVRVGVDAATVARRLAELGRLVDARERAVRESPGHDVTTGPDIVVVVDGARRLRTLPGLVPLVRDGPAVGVYAICLDADARSLPEECLAVVTCGRSSHTVAVDRSTGVQSVRADLLPAGWHDAVARGLSPWSTSARRTMRRACRLVRASSTSSTWTPPPPRRSGLAGTSPLPPPASSSGTASTVRSRSTSESTARTVWWRAPRDRASRSSCRASSPRWRRRTLLTP
nr:hypothetical protein GCM10025699_66520 [Microbacterium flavescens]